MVPTLKLVPFVQKAGEEIPDFNTIFYDRETKRIVKRTEKKVATGGLSGKMIMDTTVVYGTDRDPKFTIRAGATLVHTSEDNVDKIMTDLEQSKNSSAQLKDTLRKERVENSKLKRKFEGVQKEMKSSKAELQVLQVERRSMETTQECLEKIQQEYQELRVEKEQLLGKVEDLELHKTALEADKRQSQEQETKLQEQITSLTAALEESKEQQVSLQPFKEHVLAQRAKML